MRRTLLFAGVLLGDLAVLVSCGGGNGNPPSGPPPPPPPSLIITSASLPDGVVGKAYSAKLEATGGQGTLKWSAQGLPQGLSLDAATGVISGTPAQIFWSTISVSVSDSSSPANSTSKFLNLRIGRVTQIVTSSLPDANRNVSYSGTIDTTGEAISKWFLKSGQLPPGLSLTGNSFRGTIAGTPTEAGVFNFTVEAQDALNPPQLADQDFTLTVGNALAITTTSLPAAVEGHSYSANLIAVNGTPPLNWSVSPSLPAGLVLDPTTGSITGTPTTPTSSPLTVTVTDARSPLQQSSKQLVLSVAARLRLWPSMPDARLNSWYFQPVGASGGQWPYVFSMTSGSVPPGLTFDALNARVTGTPTQMGSFSFTVHVEDSESPPETDDRQYTIKVLPPLLQIQSSVDSHALLNRSYNSFAIAYGGTPPYTWAIISGGLPPGLSLDIGTGAVSGAPTSLGNFPFTIRAADAGSPQQTASTNFTINVTAPLGRNDTIAKATRIGNGNFSASISPYADPPDTANPDTDFYLATGVGGAPVTLQVTSFNNPLDPVLEVVDQNGVRMSTCRTTSTQTFTQACINDDVSDSSHNSYLELQTPGAAGTPTPFYIHVFDWRGDARPDMIYNLFVSGAADPLSINVPATAGAVVGQTIPIYLSKTGGYGNVRWSVLSGSLPPGMTIDAATGVISGAPTSTGTYTATVQVADSLTPPQTATGSITITVVEPLQITSTSPLPDAGVGAAYSYTFQATGGSGTYSWWLSSVQPFLPGVQVDRSGTLTVTPVQTGTFTISIGVSDPNPGQTVYKNFSLTVK